MGTLKIKTNDGFVPVGGARGSGGPGHIAQDLPPEDTSVLWIDTSDNSAGEIPGSAGSVIYDESQNLTDEQKAQARDNIGAQPAGNYLTEVPDGYAKTDDVPTDAEIIQLIKDNAPESSGGGIAVTGAKVGQTVKISAVDENGVPTAWEPTDFPSGGGSGGEWVQIANVTTEEAVTGIHVSEGIPEWANGLFFHIEAKFEASSSYNYLQPLINNKNFLNGNLSLGSSILNYNIICEIHNDGTAHVLHGGANVKTQDAQITHGIASLPLKSIGVRHADVNHGDSMLSAGTIFQVWARVGV